MNRLKNEVAIVTGGAGDIGKAHVESFIKEGARVVIADIDEKVTFMEQDLNSILVQSERYKKSTRVFTKDNQCASCHLAPDYLLHNLLKKYPSFSDVKSFMSVGHQRYYTMSTPMPDEELLEVYRTLQWYGR